MHAHSGRKPHRHGSGGKKPAVVDRLAVSHRQQASKEAADSKHNRSGSGSSGGSSTGAVGHDTAAVAASASKQGGGGYAVPMLHVTINGLGAVAGATAASVVYASTATLGAGAGAAASTAVQLATRAVGAGAGALVGETAKLTVTTAGRAAAAVTQSTVTAGSTQAAAVTAAVAGAATAVAVSVAGHLTVRGASAAAQLYRTASSKVHTSLQARRSRQDGRGDHAAWRDCDELLDDMDVVWVLPDERQEETAAAAAAEGEGGRAATPAALTPLDISPIEASHSGGHPWGLASAYPLLPPLAAKASAPAAAHPPPLFASTSQHASYDHALAPLDMQSSAMLGSLMLGPDQRVSAFLTPRPAASAPSTDDLLASGYLGAAPRLLLLPGQSSGSTDRAGARAFDFAAVGVVAEPCTVPLPPPAPAAAAVAEETAQPVVHEQWRRQPWLMVPKPAVSITAPAPHSAARVHAGPFASHSSRLRPAVSAAAHGGAAVQRPDEVPATTSRAAVGAATTPALHRDAGRLSAADRTWTPISAAVVPPSPSMLVAAPL